MALRSASPSALLRSSANPANILSSLRVRRLAIIPAALAGLSLSWTAQAQTTVVLPNTVSTIAGKTPTASTASAVCPTNAQFTAADTIGDGCPAQNATFAGNEQSIAVDPQGNIYITANSVNPQLIRKIDARTGNISIFADGSSSCGSSGVTVFGTLYTRTDKTGNGCPAAYTTGINGATGLGSDPYGNLFITTTGDAVVSLVCTAVSPLCSAAQVRVNLTRNVAGCSTATGSYGAAVIGTTVGTAGDGGSATQFTGTCTNGVGAQQRGIVGDKWDNIFFMDASNGRIRVVAGVASATINGASVANPLYNALKITGSGYTTVTQGYIYPMVGGGTVCSGKADTAGDGCPFYQTVVNVNNTGAYVRGLAVDLEGDFIFADGLGNLRVIYMGGIVIKGALAANNVASPQIGYSYLLAGNAGATGLYFNSTTSTGIYLGNTVTLQSGSISTLVSDPAGNIYIGDQSQVLFYDIATGYIRRLGGGSGAATCNSSSIGDGCPITQALFSAANLATPLGMDAAGNLYILDLNNKKTRLVSANLLPTTAVNATQASKLVVHAPATGSTVAITAASSADYTVATPTCTTNTTSDNSVDCTSTVTFAPKTLLQRTDPVSIATTVSGTTTTQTIGLAAISTGSAEAFDTATAPATAILGATTTGNTTVAVDGDGNTYVSGTQGISKISGATVTNVTATVPAYFAVDPAGAVYTAAAAATSLTKYTYSASAGTYTSSTVTIPTLPIAGVVAQPTAGPLVVDQFGVVYMIDTTSKQVVRFLQSTSIGMQLTQTALVSPVTLTQDAYGQLIVVDGTSVYKIPPSGFPITTTSPVANTTVAVTFSPALVAPTAIAADQGGNLYVAANGNIVVRSLSGAQYNVPMLSGSGVAVDGAGILYTAKSTVVGVTQVLRNAESYNFGTDITTAFSGVFLNTGATAATGFSQTDTGGNYTFAAPASPLATSAGTCNLASTALAGGAACNVSITFSPTTTGSGDTPDIITFIPAANTIGFLSLDGTKTGTNATTTTAISGNTTGLTYSTGTETTFTVTVTQSSGTPAGMVGVQIDGGAIVNYALTAGSAGTATATVPVSGLSATTHTISATFANQPGIVGSTSGNTSFTIGQASTSVSWSPSSLTQQYSAPIGSSVLNATGTSGGNAVAGVFVYTAGGQEVHAASYLARGTYVLAVTFYPTDSVDYGTSTGSVNGYTVSQATTTAGIGATQSVVGLTGSGANYIFTPNASVPSANALQNAIQSLSSTAGGNVYILPGTYVGAFTVNAPNVSLRGLGGDPTAITLTRSFGAFSPTSSCSGSPGNCYAGEFTALFQNNYGSSGTYAFTGDEGSATLVVARSQIANYASAATLTPTGFYAENLSLQNTYNFDTTSTTTYAVSGACTANAGAAKTYAAAYNDNTQCASQALAIWITADQAAFSNVYFRSGQDTIYAGAVSGGSGFAARQLYFRGKVEGNIDYIFGDAAAVFDRTSIYTTYHRSQTGNETIGAQNKAAQTNSTGDYLSGYVFNSNVFTTQSSGMTGMYLARPYGKYSTQILLNSYIDQLTTTVGSNTVGGNGYEEFSGVTNLPTSTYAEYNDATYTDPATGSADLNGVLYNGTGGSTGQGVSATRETESANPGTIMVASGGFQTSYPTLANTTLANFEAQQYYELAFLGKTVASNPYNNGVTNWDPTAALASRANAFISGGVTSIAGGSSVTILMRPQTPGLGAITNGSYTIPTGTYTLTDTVGGTTNTLASGNLDASGEAYYTTTSLTPGTHSFAWSYGGDANFAASTTGSGAGYTLTVAPYTTTTTFSIATNPITYGQSGSVTATVSSANGTPSGNVALSVDGTVVQTLPLTSGAATFTVANLNAGTHAIIATFTGTSSYGPSTSSSMNLVVNQAVLTITGVGVNRRFNQPNSISFTVAGYQYTDTAATVIATGPTVSTTATRDSVAGPYNVIPTATLTAFGSMNYSLALTNGTFTITGGDPQNILFAPLPNFPSGATYQLTARTTSGLPATYTVVTGNATVSGAALTVNGPGTVTVQAATATDGTGDYTTATPVQRSFTAQ